MQNKPFLQAISSYSSLFASTDVHLSFFVRQFLPRRTYVQVDSIEVVAAITSDQKI